ncbi:ligase-associated DNA damage response endonuclease PdeM [Xenophilus azovorans]|uniref:ligase-associated DNA damage response endonuclease PdeM n=1 Tax=Xenophilus azovorans TaxID=151755 RepID=UPI00056F81BE|nr:ligase-associated DNA damage response endonuclease PdeM [Xenophilus azovorans]
MSRAASPSSLPAACEAVWAGERLHLLAGRALWWPARRTLFVADLHLGKAAAYRALGQPVPGGTTQQNLARLDALIAAQAPQAIVFLGDFLHAPEARTPALLQAALAWRSRHAGIAMTLVRGNHDSRAGDPPPALDIAVVDEPHLLGPFACCHHPQRHATHFVLAGHLHPVCSLQGRGRDSLRLPCFVSEPGLALLPAFGEFTGGASMPAAPGRRFHAVGGGGVWALPAPAPAQETEA